MTTKTAKKDDDNSGNSNQLPEQVAQEVAEAIPELMSESIPEPVQQPSQDPDLQLRKIRELLFGAQVRQVNSDITTRYKQMTEQISALTRRMDNSFASLSSEFNSKLDDLANHLEDLNRQRTIRDDDLSADIDELRQKLVEAKGASEQVDGDIRNELHSETDRLTREIEQRHNEAMEKINKTSDELSKNKTDRKALATLLETMANNLTTGEHL